MRALVLLLLAWGCTPESERISEIHDQHGHLLVRIASWNGMKHGDVRFFHPTGEVLRTGRYTRDRREGRWLTFAPDGTLLSDLRYKNGRLEDTCRYWSAGGRLLSEEVYRNGVRHGPSRRWFADGKPRSQVAYDHGKPIGAYRRYVRDGDTTANGSVIEGEYHHGMCQGIWYTFTGDGRKMSEGRFKDNLRVGTWMYWDREGTLRREEIYRNGALQRTLSH